MMMTYPLSQRPDRQIVWHNYQSVSRSVST